MLEVVVAERVEPLVEHLAGVFAVPPADPFAPEWLAVPSPGLRRWVLLELARRLGAGPGRGDGVAANVVAAFPGLLRLELLECDRQPGEVDPWRAERLTWAVLDALAAGEGDPRLGPLAAADAPGSRFGRARRAARLFDRYHLHRPAMVRAWSAGRDVDGAGQALPASATWQPALWREVRARIGSAAPPERLPVLLDRLRAGELAADLPARLAFVGVANLPGGAEFLDLLDAVGAHRDVHLLVVEPSLAAGRAARAAGAAEVAHGEVRAVAARHPLLNSWGRLHLETAQLLGAGPVRPHEVAEETPAPATLLAGLQAAIRGDDPDLRVAADAGDRSVQFHACHGATRQVEVLRDAILHLLTDPAGGLTEDDVVVLCPALDRLAPVVEAVLGPSAAAGEAVPADALPRLRYRLADRSVRADNPLIGALLAVLELVVGRFEAPAVLDVLSLPPVRERFDLTDDDLARLTEWVDVAQIRWGLDPDHREAFGVPSSVTGNTWRSGIDRLLLGVAVFDDAVPTVGDVEPLGVEGDDAVLAGRLAHALWRLGELAALVESPRAIDAWVGLLREVAGELLAAPPDAGWQREGLDRLLADLLDAAGDPPPPVPLTLADVRAALGERVAGAAGRPDFLRGGITITSPTSLRGVPHRVVCLLGIDEPALATGGGDGDDLGALAPRPGDRDPRGELRQALLDAVLAAGDHLVVVREGRDVRTNHVVPPAVAVAELRDAVLALVEPADRAALGARLEVHHPRQAFDELALRSGGPAGDAPWSFDPIALRAATARRDRIMQPLPLLAEPVADPDPPGIIPLAELHAFLSHPIRWFVRERLGARLPRSTDPTRALLPVALTGLDGWRLGQSLLEWRLDGGELHEWVAREQRRDTLPPGALREPKVAELAAAVDALVAAAAERGIGAAAPESLPVDVELPDGIRVVGHVEGRLCGPEQGPGTISYSRTRLSHQLAGWLDLIALAATAEGPWRLVQVSRDPERGRPPVVIDLVPRGGLGAARAALADVVDLYRRGRREPLPIFPKVTDSLMAGKAVALPWEGRIGGYSPGDRQDPAIALTFGQYDHASLLAIPARPDDPPGSAPGRVARFAERLQLARATSCIDRDAAGARS